MATDKETVQFIVDQIDEKCGMTSRSMFGEYGMHSNGKFIALICNNRLFVKPTEAGKKFIGDYVEAPPYPGAKNYLLVEDKIEDGDWLTELMVATARELPEPKPKKKKPRK